MATERKKRALQSRRRFRTWLVGVVALATLVPALALVPVAAAQAAEWPVAVDVDLVEGGVWVTYSNGCVQSRAWQMPLDDNEYWYTGNDNRQCVAGNPLGGPNNLFYYPTVIRAPLALADGERVVALVPTDGGLGYWLITTAGRVVTNGAAQHLGDLSAFVLNAPVVAAAPTESGEGYYMLSADGGVFSFGDAEFYGSVQGLVDEHVGFGELAANHITAPVVMLATTPAGYWLVTADGTVFPFGDAAYHGSIQDAINLNNQLTGVARDWVLRAPVASGVPLAGAALSAPVIGVVPSGGGTGYQMVAADGGIFNFGVSQFHGSLAGRAASPAVASDVTDSRSGYVILTEEGTVYRFGVIGRQLDPIGRPATSLTPTALPASECRPSGRQGFPLHEASSQVVGPFHVGVLFIEFDEHRADQGLWSPEALKKELQEVEHYIEAMSYGQLDVNIHVHDEWISAGPFRDSFRSSTAIGVDGIGNDELLAEVLPRAAHSFDFSNNGLGYEAIMLVLPPSLYSGGLAGHSWPGNPSGVTVNAVAWVNTFAFNERATRRHAWWTTAAHELMHLPGLPDLYPYESGLQQRPKGWRTASYGLFSFNTFWPWRPGQREGWRSGEIQTRGGRSFSGRYYNFSYQSAEEMLAWHRWRMGWLRANQIECLAVGDATVDLAPVARPGDGVAMATVRLSEKRFLVLERRARIGYDADQLGAHSQDVWYYRVLDDEGVLAYTVDIDVRGGHLPVRLFAEDRQLRPGDGWILKPGDSVSSTLEDGTTLHLAVSNGPDGTNRVQITTS